MDDGRTVPVWVKRAIVWFWLGGLATFYAVGVVRALRTLLVVLVVSLFVAFALEPAVNAMARKGIRRGIGTAVTFLVATVLAAGFFALVGTALASETNYLIENAPDYIDDIEGWLDDTFGVEVEFDTLKDEFLQGGGAQDLASRFADDVVNAGATVVSLLFQLFTVALFTFYLVAEGPKLREMVSARLSERSATVVTTIWNVAMDKTGKYMYSRTILAVVSALVHWIAFALLDVPSPVALAIWVGVISQFIPAIGAYIAGVLPFMVALLHSPRTGLFVLIVIVAYQQVENYFFSPRVTAHTMEIHVALAFGAVIAGTALLGIVGAFLALPVAATAQAFISSWLDERARSAAAAETAHPDAEPAPTADGGD
ncbi:MAG: AI-2E family transporter [Acidimicrobiaceae bacterium]|nr:AI-2E family transporter [Acidimicrobiaceae bacterium]MYK75673.1 AI-2E family transporter [Acidimicrobiaceae bacterium]